MLQCYFIIPQLVALFLTVAQAEGPADGSLDLVVLELFERRLVVLRSLLQNMLLEQIDRYPKRSAKRHYAARNREELTFIQLAYQMVGRSVTRVAETT